MNRRILIATALMIMGLAVLPAAGGARTALASETRITVVMKVTGTGEITADKPSAGKTCAHVGTVTGTCTFIFESGDVKFLCAWVGVCVYWVQFTTPYGARVAWDRDFCPRYLSDPIESARTCAFRVHEDIPNVGPIRVDFLGANTAVPRGSTGIIRQQIRGNGAVASADGSFTCVRTRRTDTAGSCSKRLTVGKNLRLRALAEDGWKLSKWVGCPRQRLTTCYVTVRSTNPPLTAVFVKSG